MTLTIDRAQQLNAFTRELQAGFASALKQVPDPERSGVMITGVAAASASPGPR